MIRWLARIFYSVIAIFLLLFIFLVTPTGLNLSLKLVKKALPGELHYTHLSGIIFGPINIDNVIYNSDTIHLTIKHAHLEWHLPMLALKTISLTNFQAQGVSLRFSQSKNQQHDTRTSSAPKKLNLPFSIRIKKATLNKLKLLNSTGKVTNEIKQLAINHLIVSNERLQGNLLTTFKTPSDLSAQLTLSGKINNYKLQLTVARKQNKLVLTGQGNTQAMTLTLNQSEVYRSTVEGTTKIQWYPYVAWNATLDIRNLNLAQFYDSLPKLNHAHIQTHGKWQNTLPQFELNANISAPGTTLLVKGTHQTTWNLRYSFNTHNLKDLVPGYYGSLNTQGELSGNRPYPIIQGKFSATNLLIRQIKASAISGDFHLDSSLSSNSSLTLTGTEINAPYLNAARFNGKLNATKALSTIRGNFSADTTEGENFQLKLNLSGEQHNSTWQGKLTQFSLNSSKAGLWQLKTPAPLYLSSQKIMVNPICLNAAIGHTCIELTWQTNDPWQIKADGRFANLNLLTAFLSPHLTIKAPTTFKVLANGNSTKIKKINASFNVKRGSLTYTNQFKSLTYPIAKLSADVNNSNDDLNLTLNANLAKQDYLKTKLKFLNFIPNYANHTLSKSNVIGTLDFSFTRMKILQLISPTISQPQGTLRGNLRIKGSLPLPELDGNVKLINGFVEIPELKVKLSDIKASLSARNRKLTYTLHAKTESAPITLQGTTQYAANKFISRMTITGNNLLAANTPQYYIVISPKLNIQLVGKGIIITGNIDVPKAILKPLTFSSAVSLPDDTVIINEQDQVQANQLNWVMDVTVTLGKEVSIDAHGLKSKLNGKLRIIRNTQQTAPVAIGQINFINGTFTAQGQTLTILTGSNIDYLHDSLGNPHLNVKASRTVTVISPNPTMQVGLTKSQVGIDVKGTLKHPRASLFSTPVQLSQADILSYLLFNSPANANSLANLTTLISTVSSLNLTGGKDSSLSSVKQKLGITELGVEQRTSSDLFGTPVGVNQSSLVIGKYLTPNIYLRYNRGLLSQFNIYQARYIINKHWSIQTETETGSQGSGTGVDVLYTVSRKKFPW